MIANLDQFSGLALSVVLWAVGFWITYWVIRLAVRHAIEDVDRRRSHGEK